MAAILEVTADVAAEAAAALTAGGGVDRFPGPAAGFGLGDFDLDKLRLDFLMTLPAPGRSSKNESEFGSNLAEEGANAEEEGEKAEEAVEEEAAAGVESQLYELAGLTSPLKGAKSSLPQPSVGVETGGAERLAEDGAGAAVVEEEFLECSEAAGGLSG